MPSSRCSWLNPHNIRVYTTRSKFSSLYKTISPNFKSNLSQNEVPNFSAPPVPAGKDATRLHVWIKRPSTYDDRSGAKHDGLYQLIKDTGGRHKDVVIGNSNGYYEYGLQFNDPSWQKKPNGDGAAVSDYAGPYVEVKGGHELYEYKGEVKDKRKTLNSISNAARTKISGKVYNHKSYNCE
ncbi:uncharacterized protein G6M90_00g066750 [Metarhizium brunneum]|uniref:Uncharacterized protein n=1 Tax=Metarhizium brunneum TaxID=500148 RepID=A0A7D5Z9C8_9HYPO|nr:hypothetical protein G6M90_00g066750 [Metarhizium brunneum]